LLEVEKLSYGAFYYFADFGFFSQVNVWDKQKTFDKKQCLGEAVVKLDSLDLSQHTMAWYKLFPLGAAEIGSVESLNFWPIH
jgi:hypothetical protein